MSVHGTDILKQTIPGVQFSKKSYDNLRNFVRCTPVLRQIYNMLIFEISDNNHHNSLNIVNITKYLNVNIKTSFVYVISRNHRQVCNAL